MQFCHPLNTPRLAQVRVSVAVALSQLEIKCFLVPGGTTVPTANLLTAEAKEEKDLSAFLNLCF